MDGTVEQPAHTNDKTLTDHAENLFPFLLFSYLYHFFVKKIIIKKMIVCLNWINSDHCPRQLIALIVKFYLTLISSNLYQAFIKDRAITDGNIELQGNECLKEI